MKQVGCYVADNANTWAVRRPGTFLDPAQARTRLPDINAGTLAADKRSFCLLQR